MNHKKLYRLYREEGLSVRRRRGHKRARGTASETERGQAWAESRIKQLRHWRWHLDEVFVTRRAA